MSGSEKTRLPVEPFLQENQTVEYHFTDITGWENFEAIVKFILKTFSANVLKKVDGVYVRDWLVEINEVLFTVKYHEDIGVYFFLKEESLDEDLLVQEIAKAFNEQLIETQNTA